VFAPACIGLYFAAGRVTVAPLPRGVHKMNRFGCCSQVFVFPRGQVPGLISYFREQEKGHRDSLIEEYADMNGLERFAVTPSLFQHIGTTSSRYAGDGGALMWHRNAAQNIWNFDFERYNAEQLRREHAEAVKSERKEVGSE